VTSDGRSLALVAARLVGEASGGLARLVLEQRFENVYDENLRVTYRMPLPADGAVSGYEFVIGERTVRGVVDRKAQARERFERAIASGKTAALLEQERADIFTQQIGNIPARTAVVARITIDQRLVWLPEGEWELRFPTVIGPRYIGSADTAADVRATHVKVTDQPLRAGIQIALGVRDAIVGGGKPTSPSHHVDVGAGGIVELRQTARLDRDIVLRWRVATPTVGLSLTTARPAAGTGTPKMEGAGFTPAPGNDGFGLLTIVPPAAHAKPVAVPRDLIVLLDTSGSMSGGPLEKAKQVIGMMIDSLDESDRIELIEFSNEPRRYLEQPVLATARAKQDALTWLRSRQADGATEMRAAVIEALTTLRVGAQRQVVVVTDGYVGGEHQILEALNRRLPKSCRLHVLGVGSAVNRSLATSLARAGRGVEVIVGIDDDAERGAKRLLDRTRMPVLTNVEISGSALLRHAPEKIPDVFEGAPLVAALAVRADGGELVVRGQLARESWEQTIRVPAQEPGSGNQAIVALYGRERVADVEANAMFSSVDGEIEELGITFQIATRMTSWVAIDEASKVTGPSRDQLIPQELPYGTSASAFGLRGSAPAMQQMMRTQSGTLKGKASMELRIGAVASSPVASSMSYDADDDVGEGSVSPPGESDESFEPEAPRSFDVADQFDAAISPSRYSAGYGEEKTAAPETESFADDSFEHEEPTGLRARRSTAVGAPPAPAVPRSAVMDVKMRAKEEAAAPEKKEAVMGRVMPSMQASHLPGMSPIAPAPKKAAPEPTQKPSDLEWAPQPARAKRRIALAIWIAVLFALIALLAWWLLA
jgi:Ca-activated chloride channel family protein